MSCTERSGSTEHWVDSILLLLDNVDLPILSEPGKMLERCGSTKDAHSILLLDRLDITILIEPCKVLKMSSAKRS